MIYLVRQPKPINSFGMRELEPMPESLQWQIGHPRPLENYREVLSLTATGEELDLINMTFSGLPWHNGGAITWRGDLAVFIAEHLWRGTAPAGGKV